jgi:hypothetical protein
LRPIRWVRKGREEPVDDHRRKAFTFVGLGEADVRDAFARHPEVDREALLGLALPGARFPRLVPAANSVAA